MHEFLTLRLPSIKKQEKPCPSCFSSFHKNIRFTGGCNGNLKAIAKLCEGMSAEDIAAKLLGNTCNGKPTSCADQLARAVLGKEA